MATWVEDVKHALENLGGQSSLNDLYVEVRRIRMGSRPKSLNAIVRRTLEDHSSDSKNFNGKDYFRNIDRGIWALTNPSDTQIIQKGNNSKVKRITAVKGKKRFVSESFETLSNTLSTIQEYRLYSDPKASTWEEYVREIFHLIGYKTSKLVSRLFSLDDLENKQKVAIIVIAHPDENFENLIPGISWDSYLLFASKFFEVNWAILTNGKKIKILDCKEKEAKQIFFSSKLDEAIIKNQFNDFYLIYKALFQLERKVEDKSAQPRISKQDFSRYLLNGNVYWKNQLVLQVITEWVKSNNPQTFEKLLEVFPQSMNRNDLFTPVDEAKEIYSRTSHRRHYIKPNEIIKLPDGTQWAVTNQWSKGDYFDQFLKKAEKLGYKISKSK